MSFFPTAEGYYNAETQNYVYQYRDHLGNVRLSYSDANKNDKIDVGEIIEETNYYPFGLAHQGYNEKNNTIAQNYKYQYNAKEYQEELGLNLYDYGARNYDAAIGRWMNVDPLAEQFPGWNPYHYVHNNPVNLVDPTGMSAKECDSCGSEEDWQAYYAQAENTAAMIGEDAWGFTNKRLMRAVTEEGRSVFYLDGEKMDIQKHDNRLSAFASAFGDALLIEAPMRLFKVLGNLISGSSIVQKGGVSLKTISSGNDAAYEGVKSVSNYLQMEGVPRNYRKQIIQSFEMGTVSLRTADEATFGLRFYGGSANEVGRYLFPTFTNQTNRVGLALPLSWRNTMTGISQFQVVPGTQYIFGRAASQGGIYTGGSYQMYVNDLRKLSKK